MSVTLPSVAGGQIEKFLPGDRFTCTVAAGQSVRGGRLVALTANRTVQEANVASQLTVIGMALYDRAAGEVVTVVTEGIWLLVASGAISAGDQVVAAVGTLGTTSGRVAPLPAAAAATLTDINNARAVIGKAVEGAADAALAPIMLSL